MRKRILSLGLVLVLCLGWLPVTARAYGMGKVGQYQTINAEYEDSLTIKNDGSLWGWGDDNCGELGSGLGGLISSPRKMMDNVVAVNAGRIYTLAIKANGSLWSWGMQSGGGRRYEPTKIMDDVLAASVGQEHSLAVKTDGSLWAWGWNGHGQLGDGTTIDCYSPVKIMDNIIAVSTGTNHSFAIKTDGSLWSWGYNGYGQLGDGTTTDRYSPVKIMDNVVAVSTGTNHSLAIQMDGSLWAWGQNAGGKLGEGTTDSRYSPVKVMDNVAAVSAGDNHSLAIQTDGSLWSWGYNGYGQLGDGTRENCYSPMKIMDNVAAVSAGDNHSLAIQTDGSLWAWGNNDWGQLGDGTTEDRHSPVKIMDNVKLPEGSAGPAPTPPTETSGLVQFLSAYNAATRRLTFGDPTRVSPYTYTLADRVDASGMDQLLNKYTLVTTQQLEDNSQAYTVTDIQPVTSALGKVTATGEHSLTIDGMEYPVREDWILAASVGDEVLYHTHNGTIMGYSVLEKKHGILEGWDNTTKRVTIDGVEYPTNYLSDLTNIESYFQKGVYFMTGGSADYCPLLKIIGFYYPGGKLEDFDAHIYHAKWLAKGGNGANVLQNDTPSEILVENIEEHNGDIAIDLWRSFELVFDTLDNVSTLYEFAVEPKDIYSAQLLNALEASVSYDVVASEYEDGLKLSKELISDISKAFKADYGITLNDDTKFQDIVSRIPGLDVDAYLEKFTKDWFKENQPDLADMDKSFKWISKGLKTVSGIEDFAEYCASCYALSEVSGSMKTVLRRAYEKSAAVYGPLDNMTLALMDCVEVVNTGVDDLWQRIGMEGVTVVGEGFAKYLVKEVLWSHITSAISTKCPEVAILQVGYSAGKTISNWLCDTDDSVEQYLKMDYITDLEALVDGVYNDLRIDFYQDPTKELAQAYLSAMELSFRLRDADSEIAYKYTDILSEDLLHKIFGNQSYEDLKRSINSRRDNYADNYANAQTGWVPYLEEDYPGSGLYEKYEHLTQVANLTKLAKEIKAACPVNVYVYDQSDNMAASVVDGRVSCDGGDVMIALLGDEKIIRLYKSADYRVEYVGYDDGGMDVTISEFDEDETAVRMVNYYDVPLTNQTTYALASEDETRKPYVLEETSGGGAVEHDYDSMDNSPAHTVKVISGTLERNGEISTEAAARRGETLVLSAYVPEGYRFVRWEPDAETISIADIYGKKTAMIMPDRNVTVTAVMEKEETIPADWPDSDTAHNGPAVEEWENPYSDVDEGAWYYDAVKYVTENDLMKGYGGNRFGPGDFLSRAQFAQILCNKEDGPRAEGNPFKDVISTAWYAQTIAWAAESGIVKGYGNGSFGPEDPITREQLAVMLWRYAGSPESGNALDGFADGHEASAWARDALGWAVEQGIFTGKGDSSLDPQGKATRAEVAAMLQRYIQITYK